MNLLENNILVAGCGVSGIGAACLLAQKTAKVILYDENPLADEAKIRSQLGEAEKIEIILGKLPEEMIELLDLVVLSPGIPVDSPFAESIKKRGIPLIGEIELAWLFGRGRVAAITGTNGKTTTTALLGKIAKDYFESSFVVGNIGRPYTQECQYMQEDSVTIAEISSFQLETIDTFHPCVSAILNLTPDHLDRHHTMEEYARIKERIALNQKEEDFCILNAEDEYCQRFAERCPAKVIFFSSGRCLEKGYYLSQDALWCAKDGKAERLLGVDELKLLGIHNMENIMAAIAMADALGISRESTLSSVRKFSAVEHRIEYVTTIQGVVYYNDSKGTNPDAAIKAVQAMNRPTVLIGGGYDKESEYEEWIASFAGKVNWLILLGQTREKIAACAKRMGFTKISLVDSLEEAVKEAAERAKDGEAVLLSPACASWGMFPNYEVRGKLFKEYVWRLKES